MIGIIKIILYKNNKKDEVLTVHRWFAQKDCPGQWLYERLRELACEVTEALREE